MNKFLTWCETTTFLPAICANQPEAAKPKLSQVTGLIILPAGAPGPASWVVQSNLEGIVDNDSSDNSKAKYLVGKGGVSDPEVIIANVGKRERIKAGARYSLELEVGINHNGHYSLLQKMQGNYKAFSFWYLTQSGRCLGGQNGISPDYVSPVMPLGASHEDVEKGIINIEWYADADPPRTLFSNFTTSSGSSPAPTPITDVMFYQQSFASQSNNVLTWTANGGELPATNTKAQILVFQRGQKLEEGAAIQYTISHNTAPGESEITINTSTHFTGADYEVIAIITS